MHRRLRIGSRSRWKGRKRAQPGEFLGGRRLDACLQRFINFQVGTLRYMSPEVLDGSIHISAESFLKIDSYAFALVVWEVLTRTYANGVGALKIADGLPWRTLRWKQFRVYLEMSDF